MSDNDFWLGFWLIVLAAWLALLIFMYLLLQNDFEAKSGKGVERKSGQAK